MLAKLPETVPHRVAVILGTSGSGQLLLEGLRPLLGEDTQIDLQGVFVVDDELQHAAALQFVQELYLLTLSVREFHSTQFERAVALRTRTARKAVAELARRMGVSHTFRDIRVSTVELLRQTAHSADIPVFEPLQMFATTSVLPAVQTQRSSQHIVVAVSDPATGAKALIAAMLLAEGEMGRISILLTASAPAEQDTLDRMIDDLLPFVVPMRRVSVSTQLQHLIAAARAEDAGMLVLGASEELLKPESLRSLREQLRCPVCLVRS